MDEGNFAEEGRGVYLASLSFSVDNFVKNFQAFDGINTCVFLERSGFFLIDHKKPNEINDFFAGVVGLESRKQSSVASCWLVEYFSLKTRGLPHRIAWKP